MIKFPTGEKRLPSIYSDSLSMGFQLHAQSDKVFYRFYQLFKLFSAVYQINKIALIAVSILSMIKAFTLLVQF